MISHQVITKASAESSLAGLDSYYADAKDDYYAKDDKNSQWQGKLAHDLGLAGNVKQEDFLKLLAGKDPKNDKQLRQKQFANKDSKSRLAIDLTFSAPKSISIESLVNGKSEVLKAHEHAVTKTLKLIEQKAQARQRTNGERIVENTGNLAIAKFRHETNRNTDPQLHTHALIINLTKREDGEYRALHNDEIIKHTKDFDQIYQGYLAKELKELGYDLRVTKDGFELAHINQEQIDAFSSRSKEIENELEKQGLTRETASGELKQKIALSTRQAKQDTDKTEIRKQWQAKGEELGLITKPPMQKSYDTFDNRFNMDVFKGESLQDTPSLFEDFKEITQSEIATSEEVAQWQALNDELKENSDQQKEELYVENIKDLKSFVIQHLTDKTHVFTEENLHKTLLQKGLGIIDRDDLSTLVKDIELDPRIIKTDAHYKLNGKLMTEHQVKQATGVEKLDTKTLNSLGIQKINAVYTTQTALNQDKAIIQKLKDSHNKITGVHSEYSAKLAIQATTLSTEQGKCAELILTSTDAIVGIQGYAGTGKSFMVSKTKEILEQSGKELHIFAPYASQVKSLQKDGLDAKTVASFLKSKEMLEKINEKSVIVIDESGVINSKQMLKILEIREKTGCQLVLLGDTAQTKAVESGTPFELLQKQGMKTAYMTDIQRQKNKELLQAVKASVEQDQKESVNKLNNIGAVHEYKTIDSRHTAIVKQYTDLSKEIRENTLIVAGTNKARASINEKIRETLGTAGKGIDFTKMQAIDRTKAELNHAINFDKNDYVSFSKATKKLGLSRNQEYKIVNRDVKNNTLTVLNDENKEVEVKVTKGLVTGTYQAQKIELSVGDQIRITQTNKQKELATGDLFEIKSISKDTGRAYAEDKTGKGYSFNLDEKHHVDYAYAMTVHASQGLTYDHVICDLNTKSQTLSQETFYVAISRARHSASVYTDSIKELPQAIAKTATKENAIELIAEQSSAAQQIVEPKSIEITPQEIVEPEKPKAPESIEDKKLFVKSYFVEQRKLGEDLYNDYLEKSLKSITDLSKEINSLNESKPSMFNFLKYSTWKADVQEKTQILDKTKKEYDYLIDNKQSVIKENFNRQANSILKKQDQWTDVESFYKDIKNHEKIEVGKEKLKHFIQFRGYKMEKDYLQKFENYLLDPSSKESKQFANHIKSTFFDDVSSNGSFILKEISTDFLRDLKASVKTKEQDQKFSKVDDRKKDRGDDFSL